MYWSRSITLLLDGFQWDYINMIMIVDFHIFPKYSTFPYRNLFQDTYSTIVVKKHIVTNFCPPPRSSENPDFKGILA